MSKTALINRVTANECAAEIKSTGTSEWWDTTGFRASEASSDGGKQAGRRVQKFFNSPSTDANGRLLLLPAVESASKLRCPWVGMVKAGLDAALNSTR